MSPRNFAAVAAMGMLVPALPSHVLGEDGIVTVQFIAPDDGRFVPYKGAGLLSNDCLSALNRVLPGSAGNTWNLTRRQINQQTAQDLKENYEHVKAILAQLTDGDALVINCHSSSVELGASSPSGESVAVPWSDLFKHYGVEKPPKLSLVIVNGCMGTRDPSDKTKWNPATDGELEALSSSLGAQAVASATNKIDTTGAQADLVSRLESVTDDTVLSKDGSFLGSNIFRLTLSRLIRADKASLKELRFRAQKLGEASEVTHPSDFRDLVQATEDNPEPRLIPKGATVAPWHSREKGRDDAWTPFKFQFTPKTGREIERVEFRLTVTSVNNSLPDTDTFHGRVADGVVLLHRSFSACVGGGTVVVVVTKKGIYGVTAGHDTEGNLEKVDVKGDPVPAILTRIADDGSTTDTTCSGEAILKQIATGTFRCTVQDDTLLETAEMEVTYAGIVH